VKEKSLPDAVFHAGTPGQYQNWHAGFARAGSSEWLPVKPWQIDVKYYQVETQLPGHGARLLSVG
jgi:hypothetical protein